MRFFGLSDLHLSVSGEKPMDVFGEHWRDHSTRIAAAWRECVTDGDVVLCPGDVSWAMAFEGAAADLAFVAALPGTKVFVKGNHDYWWSSVSQVRGRFPDWQSQPARRMVFLQNDAVMLGDVAICGTRGWSLPGTPEHGAGDEKYVKRELDRLRRSAERMPASAVRVALLHYPPLLEGLPETPWTALLEELRIDLCVYGHLHLPHETPPVEGRRGRVEYRLVSADHVGFRPVLLLER